MSCTVFVDVPLTTVEQPTRNEKHSKITGIVTLSQNIPELANADVPLVATWSLNFPRAGYVIHNHTGTGEFYLRVGERPAPGARFMREEPHPFTPPTWHSGYGETMDRSAAERGDDSLAQRQLDQHRKYLQRFAIVGDHLYRRIAEPHLGLMRWEREFQLVPIAEGLENIHGLPAAIFPLAHIEDAKIWLSLYRQPDLPVRAAPYECHRPDLFSKTLRSENLTLFVRLAERAIITYMRKSPAAHYASFVASLTIGDQALWERIRKQSAHPAQGAEHDNECLVQDLLSLKQASVLWPIIDGGAFLLLRNLLSDRFGFPPA